LRDDCASWKNGEIVHNGQYFGVLDSDGLSQYKCRAGNFSEAARGRWYFNVVVSVDAEQSTGTGSVGIDLGCKEAATDSNGHGVKGREYRRLEEKLGTPHNVLKSRIVAKAVYINTAVNL
jgi:putative transposase